MEQETTKNYGEDKTRPMFVNGHEYRWFTDRNRWVRVQWGTKKPEMVGGLWDMLVSR